MPSIKSIRVFYVTIKGKLNDDFYWLMTRFYLDNVVCSYMWKKWVSTDRWINGREVYYISLHCHFSGAIARREIEIEYIKKYLIFLWWILKYHNKSNHVCLCAWFWFLYFLVLRLYSNWHSSWFQLWCNRDNRSYFYLHF